MWAVLLLVFLGCVWCWVDLPEEADAAVAAATPRALSPELQHQLREWRASGPTREGFSLGDIGRSITRLPNLIKKPVEQGIQKTAAGFTKLGSQITQGFKKMEQTLVAQVQKIQASIKAIEQKLTSAVASMAAKMVALFKRVSSFLEGIVAWLGAFVKCGADKLVQFPTCWYYYGMDLMGQLLYLPIRWLVWLMSLQAMERQVWAVVEEIDALFYGATKRLRGQFTCEGTSSSAPAAEGWHLFHWSADVQRRCYRCSGVNLSPPRF